MLESGVRNGCSRGAVALNTGGDMVEALLLDAIDYVLSLIVAIADLQGGSVRTTARHRQSDDVELHPDDRLYLVVVAHLGGIEARDLAIPGGRQLTGHLDLEIADCIEMQLESILVGFRQDRSIHQRL